MAEKKEKSLLVESLIKAQKEMEAASKDKKNPFFNSSYVDLTTVLRAVKGPLNNNGLAIIQSTRVTDNGGLVLVTKLMHSSGENITGEYPVRPVKDDPQSVGGALTYARRYALVAMVGLEQEDDDGNKASNLKKQDQGPDVVEEHAKRAVKEGKACDDCGAPMKMSGKGKLYCSAICWEDNKQTDMDKAFEDFR